jgi:hypothetical protein
VPDGASVKAVRGTSFPRDGVSIVSCRSLVDVASCLCAKETPVDRHAGRVVRNVVQALEKRRLLCTRLLDVDMMTENDAIKEGLKFVSQLCDGREAIGDVVTGDGDSDICGFLWKKF